MPLTALERRILAHLPHWVEDEAAVLAEEGPAAVRSYGLSDFGRRLRQDPNAVGRDAAGNDRHPSNDELRVFLERLAGQGLADLDGGEWRMTKAGQDLLTAEPEVQPDALPGPADLKLSAPYSESSSGMGVSS